MRKMSLSYSKEDRSSLFGVGFDVNTQLERLQAAQSFLKVRKDIEKHKTSLALILPPDFRRKYLTFRARLKDVIAEGAQTARRKLLQPLLLEDLTTERIWSFILICVTLSDDQCTTIGKASFADIFPELVKGVVGTVVVPSKTTPAVFTIIKEVCDEVDSPLSSRLLGQLS
jgi:hypothetical protein